MRQIMRETLKLDFNKILDLNAIRSERRVKAF